MSCFPNNDSLNRYLPVRPDRFKALAPFFKKIDEEKEPGHKVDGHALIQSLPGCVAQRSHTDFFNHRSHGAKEGTFPYSILIALMDGCSVYIEGIKYPLPKGAAAIIRGDVTHNGSEYDEINYRYHIYLDVPPHHVASEGTHIRWLYPPAKKARNTIN